MKILDFFKSKANKREIDTSYIGGSSLTSQTRLSQNINGLNYYKDWVFASVNARSRAVSKISFRIFKNGEEVLEHKLLNLLAEVDWKIIQSFLDLAGNSYLYKARYANGEIAKYFEVSPALIKPVIDKNNPMKIAYYEVVGGKVKIPASEIIHFKNFNPNAPYPLAHLGSSVLSSISSTVEIDEAARKWNFNFFQNSARPDGLLTTDQDITEEESERIKTDFIAQYGGVDKAHKIGFLAGGMRFMALSSTQKDIDFVEQNRTSRDEILACFGVPKSEIGIVEDVNRANAETSSYVFMKNAIDPAMEQIRKTIENDIKEEKEFALEDIKLAYWSPIPRDETARLAYYTAGVDKWLTRNEIRREEGYPELKGGDGLFNTLANVEIAVDTQKNARLQAIKDNTPDYKGLSEAIQRALDGEDEETEISIATKEVSPKKKDFTHLTDKAKENHIKAWNNIFKSEESSFIKDLRKYFSNQEEKILKLLDKAEKGFNINIISSFFAGKEWEKEISIGVSMITPKIMDYILSGADNANSSIGNDTPLEITEEVNKFIATRSTFFSESINNTTKDTLLNAIKDGNAEGLSNAEIVSKVKDIYKGISENRAQMIARTEISASANFGAVEQYKQAGVKFHEWAVVNPEDEDCLMNEGVVVGIGEAFPSGDTLSPIHPNCQCTTIAVFS